MRTSTSSKVIVVTSGQGRRGQNHLDRIDRREALAQSGQRVCVVGLSTSSLRNLDRLCSARSVAVVYDFINVAQGDAKLTQALGVRDEARSTLFTCWPPPADAPIRTALSSEGVERVIGELRMASFDWVICDSPAGIRRRLTLLRDAFCRPGDRGDLNPEISSVRDSDAPSPVYSIPRPGAPKAANASTSNCF